MADIEHLLNKIHCGDCLAVMPIIPDESIDLILADVPYGTTACKWDSIIPLEPMWDQLRRLIKPNGAIVLTASQPFTTKLIASNMKMFKYDLVWYKALGSGHLNCNRMPMRNHEQILVFYSSLPTYNPQMTKGKMRTKGSTRGNTTENYGEFKGVTSRNDTYYPQSVIDITNGDRTSEHQHPTQKPVALMEYLIKTYTNEGETVLDFTIGSGTTAVACIRTKRNFIGIELDKDKDGKSLGYCKIARKRIQEEEDKYALFGDES